MCKKICRKSVAILLSSFSLWAQATVPGLYVLGQLGSANTHAETADASALSVDSKNVLTGRIAGGYQFNANLGMEIGYTQFSEVKFVASVPEHKASLHKKVLDFSIKPLLPLANNFEGYAKLGLAYVEAKTSGSEAKKSYLENTDNWSPVFGLGLSYDITPNVLIDLAWTHFQTLKVFTKHSTSPNADFYSVGMAYYFG